MMAEPTLPALDATLSFAPYHPFGACDCKTWNECRLGSKDRCHECGHLRDRHRARVKRMGKYRIPQHLGSRCADCLRAMRTEALTTGMSLKCALVDRNQQAAIQRGDRDSLFFDRAVVEGFIGVDCGEPPEFAWQDFTCGKCGDLVCLCGTRYELGRCVWCGVRLTMETRVRWYFERVGGDFYLCTCGCGRRRQHSLRWERTEKETARWDDLCAPCARHGD